jgi:hypothetical protein
MGGSPRFLAFLTLLLVPLSFARAWNPESRVVMVDQAVRLMPASLSLAMNSHRGDLLRGLLSPLTTDGPERRAPWAGGRLDAALEAEARSLLDALSEPTPFAEVMERFGRLAHHVLEAGFPPGVSRQADAEARYAHFSAYCESRMEKFPLVFYGHENRWLQHGDYRGFALAIMQRASEEDAELSRAYALAGNPPDPAAFDDRSVPFAVGSLAYSHSVTDVVQAWLVVWQRAGGDMGRTPYWRMSEPRTQQRRP